VDFAVLSCHKGIKDIAKWQEIPLDNFAESYWLNNYGTWVVKC